MSLLLRSMLPDDGKVISPTDEMLFLFIFMYWMDVSAAKSLSPAKINLVHHKTSNTSVIYIMCHCSMFYHTIDQAGIAIP